MLEIYTSQQVFLYDLQYHLYMSLDIKQVGVMQTDYLQKYMT